MINNRKTFFSMIFNGYFIDRAKSLLNLIEKAMNKPVTEVRLTPAEKPEPEKDEPEKNRFGRLAQK